MQAAKHEHWRWAAAAAGRGIRPLLAVLLSLPGAVAAEATAYVSDELAVALRAAKGGDATVLGLVASGEPVTVLARDADSGYARVLTADGRRGWLLDRYLSTQPAARERLRSALDELEAARRRIAELEAQAGIDVAALIADNEALRGQLEDRARLVEQQQRERQLAAARRNALLAGAVVFAAGAAVGVLLMRRLARPAAGWREI